MSRHSSPPDNEVVAKLAGELRNEPPPELDWDGISKVLARRLEEESVAPHRVLPRWHWGALAAAAAAAIIAGAGSLYSEEPTANVARAVGASSSTNTVDGDGLGVGQSLEAGAEPMLVQHAGRAQWRLEPHAQAHLAEKGPRLTVQLESGVVSAKVVPSQRAESFAVEVGKTRIAVHGTEFRVARHSAYVDIRVTKGVVVAGPLTQRGHTEGWRLVAPSEARFSFDGKRLDGVAKAPSAEPESAGVVPKGAPSKLPMAPSGKEVAQKVARIIGTVEGCFKQHTHVEDEHLDVSASTDLSLSISSRGTIETMVFSPPLAPNIQACVAQAAPVRFPASQNGAKVVRRLHLKR